MLDVGRSEELCREMDKLANEDHTHHITAEEISVYSRDGQSSWNTVQQICFHQGDAFLDGNPHSVKYGELIHDRTGKLETVNHEEVYFKIFVMGSNEAEFVDKVKDQVRSRQKRMSNVAESGEEHSIICGMFMARTLNVATWARISWIMKIPSRIPQISL